MYNHPLGFNLYNLNNSKEAIKAIKKVIVFEGENLHYYMHLILELIMTLRLLRVEVIY